jgi:hypothetical protein
MFRELSFSSLFLPHFIYSSQLWSSISHKIHLILGISSTIPTYSSFSIFSVFVFCSKMSRSMTYFALLALACIGIVTCVEGLEFGPPLPGTTAGGVFMNNFFDELSPEEFSSLLEQHMNSFVLEMKGEHGYFAVDGDSTKYRLVAKHTADSEKMKLSFQVGDGELNEAVVAVTAEPVAFKHEDEATSIVRGTGVDMDVLAEARFTTGKRRFLLPNSRLALMIEGIDGESPVALMAAVEPWLNVPNGHHPFLFAARDLLDTYAEWLNTLMVSNKIQELPTLKTLDDVTTMFAPAKDAFKRNALQAAGKLKEMMEELKSSKPEEVERLQIEHSIDVLERVGNAVEASFDILTKWAKKIDSLDVASCTNQDAGAKFIGKNFVEEKVVAAAVKAQSNPAPANTDDGALVPTKQAGKWLRSGADAGAKSMIKMMDDLLADQENAAKYRAWENEKRGFDSRMGEDEIASRKKKYDSDLEMRWFKTPEEQRIADIRSHVKSQRKPLSDSMYTYMTESETIVGLANGADERAEKIKEWGKEKGKDLQEWMEGVGDWFVEIVKGDEKKGEELNKQVEAEVAEKGEEAKLEMGEREIAQSTFRAAALAKVANCRKVAKKVLEEGQVKKAGKWKTTTKGKFKPKFKFGKEILEEVGYTYNLQMSNGVVKHAASVGLKVENPFNSDKAAVRATAKWDMNNGKGFTAGAKVDVLVDGIYSAPNLKRVKVEGFAGYNKGKLKTGVFLSATVPFERDPKTGSVSQKEPVFDFNAHLNYKFNKKWSFTSSMSGQFTPSEVKRFDAKASLKYAISPTSRLTLTGSTHYDPGYTGNMVKLSYDKQIKKDMTVGAFVGYKTSDRTGSGGFDRGSGAVGVQFKWKF